MKTKFFIYSLFLVSFTTFFSCAEDDLEKESIFVDSEITKNELDLYIEKNYTEPYNIGLIYKYVDGESDMNYNLSPASYESSLRMTVLFKYLGIEPYDKITGSTDFIRAYFPKVLSYIGSPAYRNNGTMVLGTAEGGRKITMYNLNDLVNVEDDDIDFLNYYYFHTIHHEFAHILNQTRDFPKSFDAITGSGYVADSWNTEYDNSTSLADGFISAYASKEASEDFVEVYSYYITTDPELWDSALEEAGEKGSAIIEAKLEIVRSYFLSAWGIDLDVLRTEILTRQDNLVNIDQTSLN